MRVGFLPSILYSPKRRCGFTVLEVTMALAILATALVLVAQLGFWSLRARMRNNLRLEAMESAANILESARACPWDALTTQWAATQKLPESLGQRLGDGKLVVRVEPETGRPHLKRVTVEIHGLIDEPTVEPLVQLVGLFSARSSSTSGGKP